jgi:hypothetical protein
MINKKKFIAGIGILVILLIGSIIWKHSALVNYQEYRPNASLGGMFGTDERIIVTSTRSHRLRSFKKLVINFGQNISVSEIEESTYNSQCTRNVDGCRLLYDAKSKPIRLSSHLDAEGKYTGQDVEYVAYKTFIYISNTSPVLLADNDIINFINSLQPYKYSHIKF